MVQKSLTLQVQLIQSREAVYIHIVFLVGRVCSCPELESVGRKENYGMIFLLCLTRLWSEKGGGREENVDDDVITKMKEFEYNHSS